MRIRRVLLFVLLVFWWTSLGTQGQDYRGSIQGKITDASKGVIPGVTVAVVNDATNVQTRTASNDEGVYLVALLEPGTYTATIEYPGFKTQVRKGINVRTGDRLTLDIQMEIGESMESVTVSANPTILETNSADISQVVDRKFLDLLYIPNRNPVELAKLTPGVYGGGGGFADSQQHLFTINGGGDNTGGNAVTVDGGSITMPRQFGAMSVSLPGDAVEEMRVQTTMFDAAYGQSNGGALIYASRAGTNDLHGSFEWFYRNEALNANTWMNNKNGVARADDNREYYSGTVGGPLVLPKLYNGRDRTFFFTSIIYENRVNGKTYQGRVPTELERKGDFSQTLNAQGGPLTIYNPYTSVIGADGKVTRTPFEGNKIPDQYLTPVGLAMASVYPLPNLPGTPQINAYNWTAQSSATVPSFQINQRIDQQISERQKLNGRFAYSYFKATFTEVPRGLRTAPIGGDPGGDFRKFYNFSLNDDYSFSPTLIMSLRYNFGRYYSETYFSGNYQDPSEMKLPDQITKNAIVTAWPRIDLGESMITIGNRFKTRANDLHDIVPTVMKLQGNHTLRFGGEFKSVNYNEIAPNDTGAGSFSYNKKFTQADPFVNTTANTSGTSLAALVMGIPASGSLGGAAPYALRSYLYSAYVQDDWKVIPRFTLSLGVRYELETPWKERYNQLSYGFDYTSPNPVQPPDFPLKGGLIFAGVNGVPRTQGKTDYNNFGPRLGFAYGLNDKTSIRGGYALFYQSNLGNMDWNMRIPETFNTDLTYTGVTPDGVRPNTTLMNPFPDGIPSITRSDLGLATRLGQSIAFWAPDRVLGYNQQWSLGVQRLLPWQMKFDLSFVRMLSVKGMEEFELNEKPDEYLALQKAENDAVTNPFYGFLPATTSYGSKKTIARKNLWVAYPQFTSVTQEGTNSHTVVYHAVQAAIDKRFSNGIQFLTNYTGSKKMENNLTSLVNVRHYRSISSGDRPHLFNFAMIYEMPFGRGKSFLNGKGFTDKLFGGWIVSSVFGYSAGKPLGISDANGRPIRISDPSKSGPIKDRRGDNLDAAGNILNPYFDVTAFQSLPTQYMVSPEVPYLSELRAPSARHLDVSLIKRFRIWESVRFDLRADVANILNTPQWGSPGTNMATKSTFGVIRDVVGGNRTIQLSFRGVF